MKYRGPLEQKYNSRIYVGVRLDEPGKANTRGIYPDITIVKSSMFVLPTFFAEIDARATEVGQGI